MVCVFYSFFSTSNLFFSVQSKSENRLLEIKKQLKEWIEKEKSKNPKLSDTSEWLKIDEIKFNPETFTISFSMDIDFNGFKSGSLIVPERFPKGEYMLYFGSDSKIFSEKSLTNCLTKTFLKYQAKRNKLLNEIATPTPSTGMTKQNPDELFAISNDKDDNEEEEEEEEGDDDDDDDEEEGGDIDFEDGDDMQSPVYDDDIDMFEEEDNKKQHEIIKGLVEDVNKHNKEGWYCATAGASIDSTRINLFIHPRKRLHITDIIGNCWGVDLYRYLVISLTFSSFLLKGSLKPEIDSYQCGNVNKSPINDPSVTQQRIKYGLYWTVCDRLKQEYFKKEKIDTNGKTSDGKNFLKKLLTFIENKIKAAPYYCLICSRLQEHIGVKPSVCSSPLCVFSHEEYGLGCDLESEILNNSSVVDMLITTTYAAASAPMRGNFNSFNPFPTNIEVKVKKKNKIQKKNFVTNNKPDNSKVRLVMEKIPKLKHMAAWVKKGILKKELDKIDVRIYALLRWIITSNRSHLHKLSKSKCMSNMKTDLQYLLISGSAEKEREFQDLKRQYGAVYAWHGSPLYNWHAILRIGLKNMSGTKGQLHGSAYGKGVYFAPNSSTSFGYMKFHSGWMNSEYTGGQLGIIALCEIINHPNYKGQPKPYYVIPDEKHITTRLFFVFPNSTSGNVIAKDVVLPQVKWYM